MPRKDRKGGRSMKPTRLKMLEGNPGGRSLSPETEPQPSPDAPEKPMELFTGEDGSVDATASKEWDRIIPILEEMGLLSKTDTKSIALYCLALSETVSLHHNLRQHGYSVPGTKTQRAKPRPEVRAHQVAQQQVKYYINLFGLTPGSRAGMGGEFPKDAQRQLTLHKQGAKAVAQASEKDKAAQRFFGS